MGQTYSFAQTQADYARRWEAMQIPTAKVTAIDKAARKVLAGKARYEIAASASGVPWWLIGAWHHRESGCDFAGVLHNGEEILGTGRKTRLVPKGRGPFETWEDAARDALAIKGYHPGKFAWTVERVGYESERFNGFGYRMHGVPSAYLWSFSDQYARGKYVADGKWSAAAIDKQIGVMPLLRRMMALDPSITFDDGADDGIMMAEVEAGDGLTDAEIRAVQQRLRDLGYSEVGMVDGLWGPRTTGGIAAFQATAGLPVTGHLDAATAAALTTSGPRPVSTVRAEVTAKTLRQDGDPIATASWWTKAWAWIIGAPAATVGIMEQAPAATGKIATLRSILDGVPGWAWALAAVALAVALYILAQRGETARVAAIRTGEDAGPA